VRRVNQTSSAAQQLQPGDVLLSFDGQAIANDGTVPFRYSWLNLNDALPATVVSLCLLLRVQQ
jgi:hypothetical protein